MGNGRIWNELSQGNSVFYLVGTLCAKPRTVKLVATDEKKTVIAEFYLTHHFTKKQKARLDVQLVGMDMLDHIVLTFVVAEQKRREREVRAKFAHGGGP